LNNGQDWEDGFLHGVTSSSVIVLLLSNKVQNLKKQFSNAKEYKNSVEKEIYFLLPGY
jgi:hypothetical protein